MNCRSGYDITANGMVLRRQCVLLPVDVASSQQEETLAERKKEGGRHRKSKEQLSDVPVIYLSSGTMYLFHFLLLLLLSFTLPCRCKPLSSLQVSVKMAHLLRKRHSCSKLTKNVRLCQSGSPAAAGQLDMN